jgi:hypothetical protein
MAGKSGFDAREHVQELDDLEGFEYTHTNGNLHVFPNAALLTIDQVTGIEENAAETLRAVLGEDAYADVAELPLAIGEQLILEWMKHGGRLGKSVPRLQGHRPGGKRSNSTRRSGGSRSRRR